MSQYDDIIIGGGHNGLICASYLAKSGRKVLLLESAEQVGGLAATYEFHPNFRISVAHSLSHFSKQVANELNLADNGCNLDGKLIKNVSLGKGGKHIVIDNESISGVSDTDQSRYSEFRQLMKKFAALLSPFWLKTIPRIGQPGIKANLLFATLGLKLRLLGKEDMSEFMRVATLPTRDIMDEYFDNEQLKAMLSWDALIGAKMAPRSPNGSILSLLYKMSEDNSGMHYLPSSGGINALISALKKVAESSGVEIKTNCPVEKINIEGSENGLKTSGVTLQSGEIIEGKNIISAVDPKRTFLNMVGVEYLDIEFTNRVSRLSCDGLVAKLHLALDTLPDFTGVDALDGRLIIAPTQDTLEFSYDNAKYGESPEQPVMEILLPSVNDSTLAPEGKHVLTAHVMYVPGKHKEGWTAENKSALYERIIDVIEEYAPNIRETIISGELLTPLDIEKQFGVTGGHWHHGELSIWQMLMMRPTYEAAQYSTPIPGLFLCSAGCHPGGGLSGAAGHNAAKEILKATS